MAMASKQLGKLRQWAGEVISSKDKSTISEELLELEKDIELRKEGAHKLYLASEAYHHALSKKKLNEALSDTDKLLPVDGLGIVMIVHGEEFDTDSQLGNSLITLGRAQCKVATLQEAYALTFKDTFVGAIEKFREEIKEYELLRKKLDSRRLSLDAASSKVEKVRNSKKEKDKREAEDELDRAQQRYEETAEDIRAHMHAIQENEISQQRELTAFLDLEINFVQQHLDVLKEVRAEWPDGSASRNSKHRNSVSSRSRQFNIPAVTSRFTQPISKPALDSSEDEEPDKNGGSRFGRHKKSDSTGSRTPSRPSSRLSRKRTNSTAASSKGEKKEKEKDKDKDKETEDKPRRLSVAGWASSAVESMTSRGKKVKDKDAFASLDDDGEAGGIREGERPTLRKSTSFSLSRRLSRKKRSKENFPEVSPKVPPRILKPPSLQDKRIVHALYDFNGSVDELSFKAGTDITVLNEVVDGWWMGEIDGKKGLFPTSHVSSSPLQSSLAKRPLAQEGAALQVPDSANGLVQYAELQDAGYGTSDLDEEFGHQPLGHNRSPFYAGFNDVASITSNTQQEEPLASHAVKAARRFSDDLDLFMEQPKHTPRMRSILLHDLDTANQPLINRTMSEDVQTSPTKRIPPPPPPPRRPAYVSHVSSPAIPERRPGPAARFIPPHSASSSESVPSFARELASSSLSNKHHGIDYDVSPFESAAELSGTPISAAPPRGCGQFRQNPFQPVGMCSNCRVYHS